MSKYVVLKNLAAANAPAASSGPFLMRSGTLNGSFPEPKLSVEDLSPRTARDATRDPSIVDLAPVMPTKLIKPVSDADAGAQAAGDAWGITAVGANSSPFNGSGIKIAVLDTGIDATHPAFQGIQLTERDFSGDGNGDVKGHGTHCAGTIAGRDVDGKRIGVARGVNEMLIGKVLGNDGSGSSEMAFDGIQWAVQEGAHVISMSLGFDFPGLVDYLIENGWPTDVATSAALEGYRSNIRVFDALMDMVRARAAFGDGTVVVAAAGNESRRNINPNFEVAASIPAAANGIISVGALGQSASGLSIASFSNTMPKVSAPGVAVLSAKAGGGLTSLNGTSMACPHVSGVTALWWQAVQNLPIPKNAETVATKLIANARTEGFIPGIDIADRGAGIVMAPQN